MDANTHNFPPLLDVRATAGFLCISRSKLYDLVSIGAISPVKIGNATRFRRTDLLAFIDALPTAQKRVSREG